METKSQALQAIAGFVDWFGRRWIAPRSEERANVPADAGSHFPNRSATDSATSTCAAACPPTIRGRLYANPGALPVHLKFSASPRVPGGLDAWCVGFDDIHSHYRWHSSWFHPTTGIVASSTSPSTAASLMTLRARLQAAVVAGNIPETRDFCLAILKWGGVSGAAGFINRAAALGTLPAYLTRLEPLLNVGALSTAGLTPASVLRFDAGMTKIHSIFDSNWTPIYDSRVGAAIAMLFELYYADTGTAGIAGLAFSSGPARGKQIRDPGYFPPLSHAPQFYTAAVPPHVWAQSQLKLAWVIEALLQRHPSLFASRVSLASRAEAFEATLFMLGYDLRCFVPALRCLGLPFDETLRGPKSAGPRARPPRGATWVPTGISMSKAAGLFLEYATARGFNDLSAADFITWQTERSPEIPLGYARANATMLRPLEFDLCDRSEDEIRRICGGGEAGLRVAMAGRGAPVDERERVCLVAALLYGALHLRFTDREDMIRELIDNGIAFAEGSAGTLLSVGSSVGKFFGLLDADGVPTEFYDAFFADPDWQDLIAELLPLREDHEVADRV